MSIRDLLKDGTRHFSGTEEATLRNIEACTELSKILRSSFGPNGMNKMVINHLEKLYVTNDAATIMRELDVVHPAAKMMTMAAKQMENEVGDNTNFVVVFAGELLHHAESLIMTGLHVSDIIAGYQKAGEKALSLLADLVVDTVKDIRDAKEVGKALRSAIAAKQYGREDLLAPLVAEACISILPQNPLAFSVDSVRVCKVMGGGVDDTKVFKGFALPKDSAGTIKHVKDAKVLVLASGLEASQTETSSTVLLTSADELMGFTKSEEDQMHEYVKEIVAGGANVVVVGGAVSEIALHYCEKYNLMVVKEPSKFQLRRICRATGAVARVHLGKITAEEIGSCDSVTVEEVGSTKVTFFYNDSDRCFISTILCRGSTPNVLDDIERCIDDAVNVFKSVIRNNKLVAGAGACELELARKLASFGAETPGLDQYAIKKFAEALEIFPRTLAENAGVSSIELITELYAAHDTQPNAGVNVEEGNIADAVEMKVFDMYIGKWWAIQLAVEAALNILRVDQIIMSKPAGGPQVPKMGPRD
mmetsp:Transcript_17562/g.68117  ORF Transcript_17562/g.68117 Transcript_17562/m.68117 type:complete len:533 (+) Transcript_17562:89-1687(+)